MSYEIELEPLEQSLIVPPSPRGIILLGDTGAADQKSGFSRAYADELKAASYASCVVEWATDQGSLPDFRFGSRIDELSRIILGTAARLRLDKRVRHLPLGGLFSGAASAAAMVAAASDPNLFKAIVSYNGRPDLAEIKLHRVQTPSLLLISKSETELFEMNRWAQRRLLGATNLHLIDTRSGAKDRDTHEVIRQAAMWFDTHFGRKAPSVQRTLFKLPFQRGRSAPAPANHG